MLRSRLSRVGGVVKIWWMNFLFNQSPVFQIVVPSFCSKIEMSCVKKIWKKRLEK